MRTEHFTGGHIVHGNLSINQVLENSGINFTCKGKRMIVEDDNSSEKNIIKHKKAIVRTDTNDVLGVVSNKYTIIQNSEALKFFDHIVDQNEASYESAGSFDNGALCFVSLKLKQDMIIKKFDDHVENNLLLCNSHNGKSSLFFRFTPVRVRCRNVLVSSKNFEGTSVSIRHSMNYEQEIERAINALGIVRRDIKKTNISYNIFAQKTMTDKQFRRYATMCLTGSDEPLEELSTRYKNLVYECENFYQTGIGQEEIVGTVWGAFNGVTGYIDHILSQNKKSEEIRDQYKIFGSGFKKKESALLIAEDFCHIKN